VKKNAAAGNIRDKGQGTVQPKPREIYLCFSCTRYVLVSITK